MDRPLLLAFLKFAALLFYYHPLCYACSMAHGKTGHKLCELYISPLAEKIEKAIERAQLREKNVLRARLLNVPVYHVFALWLTENAGEDVMVIVDAPPNADFKLLDRRSDAEFLRGLRRLKPEAE
ncbi:MAG TPA: hypothetical protein PLD20_08745 [Blastocatellia bacterium]|nr:hypothetical protein [Blastocatellia bacterium]HMV83683.1 hypothetical protein [Blastocatellia bacterium]HMX28672.1 hypothetical protein [Blastocatellia bacterium]HMY70930.1 hypothetical protein [Blastocatellia bacterium]HMZ18003.1 hypothetical protein [Blastocatellia bacterium]